MVSLSDRSGSSLRCLWRSRPAAAHRCPQPAPGLNRVRCLPVFGHQDRGGHAEITCEDVLVPATDVLKGDVDVPAHACP